MDVRDALKKRRMVRSFDGSPVSDALATSIFKNSLRAPTAGNCRGVSFLVLVGSSETQQYFETATDHEWRASARRAPGLQRASAIGICVCDPACYVERYASPDKAASGLGTASEDWPVPFWVGDAGSATMAALLLAEESGLAAAFLGAFRRQDEIKERFAIPAHCVVYGSVLLGRPDGLDHRSRSLDLPGPGLDDRIHRLRFS